MPIYGKDAVAYLSTEPLSDTNEADEATWVEVDNLQDETDNFSSDEIDITTRASAKAGWTSTAYTVKNAEVSFTFLNELTDPLAAAVVAAWLSSGTIAMMFLSASEATVGAMGLAANWAVSLTFSRPVRGVQSVDATLKAQSKQTWVTTAGP